MKHVGFSFNNPFSEAMTVHPKGETIMSPRGLVKDPISALSLGLRLLFCTSGLPHILMRFFTVSNAREARKSVLYATAFMGYFYILTFIIGFPASILAGANPAFKDAAGTSTVSHDLYANAFRKGATKRQEPKASKITVLVLGMVAILLGILFERQNISFNGGVGLLYHREP